MDHRKTEEQDWEQLLALGFRKPAPGFLEACKEAGVKDEDPLVARDKLEEWAPPGYYPPEGLGSEPPSYEGDDAEEFTRFVLEELTPWYEWATQDEEGRPCRDLIDQEYLYTQ